MPTSFLEIVELPDGRIELRRAEDEGSLVTLDFSEDAKAFLQGQHVEVAKAMFCIDRHLGLPRPEEAWRNQPLLILNISQGGCSGFVRLRHVRRC
jgi:hypothetical protein